MKYLLWIGGGCAFLAFMLLGNPTLGSSGLTRLLPEEEGPGPDEITNIEEQVAADAIARYRLVEAGSSQARRCEEARAAAEALSRTRLDMRYERWKETAQKECAATERSR